MSHRSKDIVDRLNDLEYILGGDQKNHRNKFVQTTNKNQNRKLPPKKAKKALKKSKHKIKKHPNSENSETEENEFYNISNQQQIISDNQNENEYLNYEEEEDNEQYLSFSFDIDKEENNSEYEENTEHIFEEEEEEDNIRINNASPIRNIAIKNVKSDVKSFYKLTYFRKWRRAYHAKKIKISIENKMKKYKFNDKKKDDFIYKPCYYIPNFKKATLEEQRNAIKRLTKPKNNPTKVQNQDVGNEIKINSKRQYVRQIAHERDEKEKASKPISQKRIKKAVDRLSAPKPKHEESPVKPKPTISQRQQFQISLRLSVPKKELDEEPVLKKTNKFILPTKKEQLEICDRLAQPKPDFSPKPIKRINRLSREEQKEICERLSNTKEITKKKKDDDYSNDQNVIKNKKVKKSKKKGKKHSKNKIKTDQNLESTFVSNQDVHLPTSPVPPLNCVPSPLNFNTPKRKVRFNGLQSGSKQKKDPNSKLLSQMVDDALEVTHENDSRSSSQVQKSMQEFSTQLSDEETTPNRRNNALIADNRIYSEKSQRYKKAVHHSSTSNKIKQTKKESQYITNTDDDQNQKQNGQIFYHPLTESNSTKSQEKDNYPSSDDGQKQSQDEIKYPLSEDDDQNQLNNQSEVHISSFIDDEEENIQEEVHFPSNKNENNEQDQIAIEKVQIISQNDIEEEEEKEAKIEINVEDTKGTFEEEDDNEEEAVDENNFELKFSIVEEEEEEEDFDENQTQNQFSSLLKSSENNGNGEDEDEDQNQDQFYFENRPPEFSQEGEKISLVEEEEEEDFASDNLFEKEDNIRSSIPLRSRTPSYASLKSHRSINSIVESETLKEAQKIDMNKYAQDNIFGNNGEEEEDEADDETAINENISGIAAHSPIKGLTSNSEIEMHLFSKTLDSAQDSASFDNS